MIESFLHSYVKHVQFAFSVRNKVSESCARRLRVVQNLSFAKKGQTKKQAMEWWSFLSIHILSERRYYDFVKELVSYSFFPGSIIEPNIACWFSVWLALFFWFPGFPPTNSLFSSQKPSKVNKLNAMLPLLRAHYSNSSPSLLPLQSSWKPSVS